MDERVDRAAVGRQRDRVDRGTLEEPPGDLQVRRADPTIPPAPAAYRTELSGATTTRRPTGPASW